MAGKTKPMSKIKQLLRMHQQGYGIKTIARDVKMSKNTVKAYLQKISMMPCSIESLLALEDPKLDAKLHAGNPAYKESQRYEHVKSNLGYYISELNRTGVTKRLLWEEYRQNHPDGYSYTQFCFHVNQQLLAKKPSMVLNHKPGEKLYVDFAGKKLSYVDKETGEIVQCPVFVACLPYSDYGFAIAVRSQGVEDFIFALQLCIEYLGGVSRLLVPDNLKSAITKANYYEPDINQALEDFCNHYGMSVVPARVKKPKDKALVENQVKLVYNRVYAKLRNRTFFDLHSLNQSIKEKIREHNQTRMQRLPYCREEKFLSDEKPLLSPLPGEPYEIKYYGHYKVDHNNHILLGKDNHFYSVPFKWTGQRVKVIYTRSLVRIFAKGELVAIHPRELKGKYTTNSDHLCSTHQHYLKRSPEYYRKKAKEISHSLFLLVDALFNGGRPPEQNYRTCEGFFSLYRKTEPAIFNQACNIALECQTYSYGHVLKLISNLQKMPKKQQEETPRSLPKHENIRGKNYYKDTNNQLTINFSNDETN
jgi:transposase